MGIIQQAKQQTQADSYLIWGINGSGRTTVAVEQVAQLKRVLYVGFSNFGLSQFLDEIPETWDSVLITSWDDFMQLVINPAREGSLDYEGIIIDDYDVAIEYITATMSKVRIQDYQIIANKVGDGVTAMKSLLNPRNGVLVVTLTVVDAEVKPEVEGASSKTVRKININPATKNRLVSKFNHRWYTYAKNGEKGIEYGIQTNPLLANKFSAK